MIVRTIAVESLGNRSYLVADEQRRVAAAIDPTRDADWYLAAARELGVTITHIFETHLHADFISGSRELAARTHATICASAAADLRFPHEPLHDGQQVAVGDLRIAALATPGHTPEHLAYTVAGPGERAPLALFSGGSLLSGAVARTDLIAPEQTRPLTRALYHALHQRILALPDETPVYPTHGGGSFCSVGARPDAATTIGHERRANRLLTLTDPEAFVEAVLAGFGSYPGYFMRLRPINQRGPRVLGAQPDLSPLTALDLRRHLLAGNPVVDLRPPAAFAAGHLPGACNIGLAPAFATWVGWLLPLEAPIAFVADDPRQRAEAVRQLLRIGYENLVGYLYGGLPAWMEAGFPLEREIRIDVHELCRRRERGEELIVLDVRQQAEWEEGHVPGARHLELGSLPLHMATLPAGRPIAVYCGGEYRSAIAASLLRRAGRREVLHVVGGMEAWRAAGYPVAP